MNRGMRYLVCERRSVPEHQSLLLTPRPLDRGDEILDRERAWLAVGDESLQNNWREIGQTHRAAHKPLRDLFGDGNVTDGSNFAGLNLTSPTPGAGNGT